MTILSLERRPFAGEGVLCYYNGPMLMWLDSGMDRYLAVALDDSAGPWPFLLARLDADAQEDLLAGRMTLRDAFTGRWPRLLLRDYGAPSLVVEPVDDVPEDWMPGDVCL